MDDTKLREESLKMISQEANDIYNMLVVENDNNKLPEDIFVNYFLPYFANPVSDNVNNNKVAEWVSIAGTPVAEVDIVDNNNKVLYSVPSLFDTSVINLNKLSENHRFNDIMNKFDLQNNNIPSVAQYLLKQDLGNKLENMTEVTSNRLNKEKQWRDIFSKYGYIKETKTKDSQNDSDELEYE